VSARAAGVTCVLIEGRGSKSVFDQSLVTSTATGRVERRSRICVWGENGSESDSDKEHIDTKKTANLPGEAREQGLQLW
jgi:hypothetical protein